MAELTTSEHEMQLQLRERESRLLAAEQEVTQRRRENGTRSLTSTLASTLTSTLASTLASTLPLPPSLHPHPHPAPSPLTLTLTPHSHPHPHPLEPSPNVSNQVLHAVA